MGNSSQYDTTTQYNGRRRLTVEGGEMASIAGGVDCFGSSYTTYGPNDGDNWKVRIRIKGGTIRGAIYGAGAYNGASYDRYFVFTGGTINGWVAGGCNGTRDSGGELYGSTYMYIGGKVKVVQSDADPLIGGPQTGYGTNGAYGGNIFGAGCGIKPTGYDADNPGASLNSLSVGKVFGSTVVIADGAVVGRDVYGGGNFGMVAGNSGDGWNNNTDMTARVYLLGGTVGGSVYGGSNNQQGQTVQITMKGGTVEGNIYGGSNSWGTINKNVTVNVYGGTVANIFGGNNLGGNVLGNIIVNINHQPDSSTLSTKVYNITNVYGGGNNAPYTPTVATGGYPQVNIVGGTVNGCVYGGGYGTAATVTSCPQVTIGGSAGVVGSGTAIIGGVGGDGHVFGGGCEASVVGNPTVTLLGDSSRVNGSIFGAGRGKEGVPDAAKVTGNTNVVLKGGEVMGSVYGGGLLGQVDGDTQVTMQ